jgi:hypothetical protein
MDDALHVGLSVHHLLFLPEEDKSELQAVCEAALVTSIRRKEEGVVSLSVFPEGSEIVTVGNVAHSLALKHDTWHFISECQTDS